MDHCSNTAVFVQNASKSYGKKPILQNLNMHVEKGIIYGLLGASGCGKTTLLSCIVGRKSLNSGTIWVLGGSPGSSKSGVPGPRVGYMPQDVALVAEFTIKAAIYYFGRILCMSDKAIEARFNSLSQLLDLPPADRIIANCSGGQQRRVSFAAALMSNPELLILDEPTVGLDPVLRESIWNYLIKLTESHMSSVIITTHYIEETRQAHKIGLMRQGKLLAEDSPEKLLHRFSTNSLENVFLVLSKKQEKETWLMTDAHNSITNPNVMDSSAIPSTMMLPQLDNLRKKLTKNIKTGNSKKSHTSANTYGLNGHRLKALIGKSWLQVTKNYSGVGFMFVFPIFEILAFFLAVGADVKNIKIVIVNDEEHFGTCENYIANSSVIPYEDGDCQFQRLGCRFLQHLHDPMIDTEPYHDISKAKEAIRHGYAAGALYIPIKFTESLYDKFIHGGYENETLNDCQIQAWLDMSNRQVGTSIKAKLIDKVVEFQKSLFEDCKFVSKFVSIPINFDDHIYGHLDDNFMEFMIPGILLTIIFFLGTSNASSIIITDRLEGIWDRSIVAGVSSLEIILVHFLTQVIIITIQAAIVLIMTFIIYQMEYIGSFVGIAIIVLLQGITGIVFGFLISIVSNGHSMAHLLSTGSFYPMLVLCGLMWPIEGMAKPLRSIALFLPFTLPIISLRNIMKKGWSILHKEVLNGIGVELGWIIILGVISSLVLKRSR